MSDFATRTSRVGNCATGAAGGLLSDPLARYVAMPPAPTAMVRTTMRAVFIRFTFHMTPRRFRRGDGSGPVIRQGVVNKAYLNLRSAGYPSSSRDDPSGHA